MSLIKEQLGGTWRVKSMAEPEWRQSSMKRQSVREPTNQNFYGHDSSLNYQQESVSGDSQEVTPLISPQKSFYQSQGRRQNQQPIFSLKDIGKVSHIVSKRLVSHDLTNNAKAIALRKLNIVQVNQRAERDLLQQSMHVQVPRIEDSKAAGVVYQPQKIIQNMTTTDDYDNGWGEKKPKKVEKSVLINSLLQDYSQTIDHSEHANQSVYQNNQQHSRRRQSSVKMPKIKSQSQYKTDSKVKEVGRSSQYNTRRSSIDDIPSLNNTQVPDITHLKQLHSHIKVTQNERKKASNMYISETSDDSPRKSSRESAPTIPSTNLKYMQTPEKGKNSSKYSLTEIKPIFKDRKYQSITHEPHQLHSLQPEMSPDRKQSQNLAQSIALKKPSNKIVTTKELVKEFKAKHKEYYDKKVLFAKRQMKGRTLYKLPETNDLRKTRLLQYYMDKEYNIKQLAKDEQTKEGQIALNNKYQQVKERDSSEKRADPTQKYVNHFSQLSDMIEHDGGESANISSLAKNIQLRLKTNQVKSDLKHALFKNLTKKRDDRESLSPDKPRTKQFQKKSDQVTLDNRQYAFNKSLEEETKQMDHIADMFLRKKEYQDKFTNIQKYNDQTYDPRITFYNKCQQDGDLVLPILDKIWKKTLCLNNYFLSEGNIRGLASACEVLDFRLVNRLLLNNCGITGDQFSEIIQGISKIRDFKSLIYKQNAINESSIQLLKPVFEKRLPHHLEELKIIDCKIAVKHVVLLMDSLLALSQLKKLALINVHHTVESFEKVVKFVEESNFIEEIDLSWSIVPKGCWLKLMNVLGENRKLRNLQIGYNQLLEDQNWKITSAQKSSGVTEVALTPRNEELLEGMKNFIKYNPMLVHLDLQMTGLPTQVIKMIGNFLTRATGLQVIHLCGNEGISEETIEWIRKRIRARDEFIIPSIQPLDKQTMARQTEPPKPAASGVLGLFGIGKKGPPVEQVDPQKEWKELRAGLKLQSIINSKRMNEIIQPTLLDKRKCIIQRHLGCKLLIPGAAQWRILTETKDECWFCGSHILSLFIWSPRIGQLSQMKSEKARKHFKDQFDKLKDHTDFAPPDYYENPHIKSNFTDWKDICMRDVVHFCKDNDPNPPNFIPKLIHSNMIRPDCGEPVNAKLTEHEKGLVQAELNHYYDSHWSSVIMDIMQFKNPLVANAHAMTSLTAKVDPHNRIHFHIDWIKPGRHNFIVNHDQDVGGIIDANDKDDLYQRKTHIFMQNRVRQGKKSNQNFYVHEMLATLRSESVPLAFKDRHTTVVHRKMFKPKPVFNSWIQDNFDTYRRLVEYDTKFIPMNEIMNGDAAETRNIIMALIDDYVFIKDIFHFLQSQSQSFPNIDMYTIRKHFLKQLDLKQFSWRDSDYEIILTDVYRNNIKSLVAANEQLQVEFRVAPGFTRAMFAEVILRLSKLIFTHYDAGDGTFYGAKQDQVTEFNTMGMKQAFQMFSTQLMRPYLEKQNVNWQAFRDQYLSHPDVELVFTMNLNQLDDLYKKYSKMHQGTEHKAYNEFFIVQQDLIQLFNQDSLLKVPKFIIKKAFAMSKMTVVQELEHDGRVQYRKLEKVEFLEFISRLADQVFHESEMQDLELYEKIEHVLDDIFPLINAQRVKQKIEVHEFSESDDDY